MDEMPPQVWTTALVDLMDDPSKERMEAFIQQDLGRSLTWETSYFAALTALEVTLGMLDAVPKEALPRGARTWIRSTVRYLRRQRDYMEWRKTSFQ